MTAQKLTQQEFDLLLTARPPVAESSDNRLGSPFLRLLATAGRDLLSRLMSEQHYEPGQIIFKEGEMGDAMYIIWAGRAAVVRDNSQSPTILGDRGAGEIIGEKRVPTHHPRRTSTPWRGAVSCSAMPGPTRPARLPALVSRQGAIRCAPEWGR